MIVNLIVKMLLLLGGFALWALIAYLGKAPWEPLIDLLKMGLGGLVVHMLAQDGAAPAAAPAAPAPAAQGGFASIRLLGIVAAILLAACTAGCTTTTASAYQGLYTQAKAGVQVFDDNSLKTLKDLLCAQPYSAVQRNVELQDGFVTLCGQLSPKTAAQAQLVIDAATLSKLQEFVKALAPVAPASPASNPAAKP